MQEATGQQILFRAAQDSASDRGHRLCKLPQASWAGSRAKHQPAVEGTPGLFLLTGAPVFPGCPGGPGDPGFLWIKRRNVGKTNLTDKVLGERKTQLTKPRKNQTTECCLTAILTGQPACRSW